MLNTFCIGCENMFNFSPSKLFLNDYEKLRNTLFTVF